MQFYATIRLDLTDSDTLFYLKTLCRTSGYYYNAEYILSWISHLSNGEVFGEYLQKEYTNKKSEFRKAFDKDNNLNIWKFFQWIDNNAEKVAKAVGFDEYY